MKEKYLLTKFGVCPRVLCERQTVLPIGMAEELRTSRVKVWIIILLLKSVILCVIFMIFMIFMIFFWFFDTSRYIVHDVRMYTSLRRSVLM